MGKLDTIVHYTHTNNSGWMLRTDAEDLVDNIKDIWQKAGMSEITKIDFACTKEDMAEYLDKQDTGTLFDYFRYTEEAKLDFMVDHTLLGKF